MRWFKRSTPPTLSGVLAEANRYNSELQRTREVNRVLTEQLTGSQAREAAQREDAREFLSEMIEAQAMCGAGPWAPGDVEAYAHASKPLQEALRLTEAGPVSDVAPLGAYGMYELLLQNVGWQREINYSWLEFTRWGIQQIILICRLYYLKNPIPRRLVDVCAQYVFARGVDVTTQDPDANEALKAFFARNQKVLGHVALMNLEKAKDHDGNLFFAFFTNKSTGEIDIRMIDATEMQDIWCDPEDADKPQFYRREWTQRNHDPKSGTASTEAKIAWYPDIAYEPTERPESIAGHPVMWDSPVYHRKVGQVGRWLFGCPRIYPMLDWAKEAKRYLEACAGLAQSLAQFARTVTTKGGAQAVEGVKQGMQTTVGPGAPGPWDVNPPAVVGAAWISGSGTTHEAFKTQGAGLDPEKVRRLNLMCCMVKGVPETFLADVSTGNLATATSLDRPTETVMLSLQEEWIEDLTVIARYALTKSLRATGGKLREAVLRRKLTPADISVCEAARVRMPDGRWRYAEAAAKDQTIEIRVDFPAIREGDVPAQVGAIVKSMTLDNRGGQVVGIDEKEGNRMLYRALGSEKGDEIVERQYPEKEYDPDRTSAPIAPPIPKMKLSPGGLQPEPDEVATSTPDDPAGAKKAMESLKRAARRLARAIKLTEAEGGTDAN